MIETEQPMLLETGAKAMLLRKIENVRKGGIQRQYS
jgi:hypothetical protein